MEVVAVVDQNAVRPIRDSRPVGLVGSQIAIPGVVGKDGAGDSGGVMVGTESLRCCRCRRFRVGLDRRQSEEDVVRVLVARMAELDDSIGVAVCAPLFSLFPRWCPSKPDGRQYGARCVHRLVLRVLNGGCRMKISGGWSRWSDDAGLGRCLGRAAGESLGRSFTHGRLQHSLCCVTTPMLISTTLSSVVVGK